MNTTATKTRRLEAAQKRVAELVAKREQLKAATEANEAALTLAADHQVWLEKMPVSDAHKEPSSNDALDPAGGEMKLAGNRLDPKP